MTLGQLIKELKRTIDSEQPDKGILFDFGAAMPTTGDSYRGYYNQFALGYDATQQHFPGTPVTELVKHLEEDCLGKEFHGWKGGEYRMTDLTPVWIANRGETTSTVPVGVRDMGYFTLIDTQYHEH